MENGTFMMDGRQFLRFLIWFLVASAADTILRHAQASLDADWKWIHLEGIAFAVVLYIGVYMGRNCYGWWFPFSK